MCQVFTSSGALPDSFGRVRVSPRLRVCCPDQLAGRRGTQKRPVSRVRQTRTGAEAAANQRVRRQARASGRSWRHRRPTRSRVRRSDGTAASGAAHRSTPSRDRWSLPRNRRRSNLVSNLLCGGLVGPRCRRHRGQLRPGLHPARDTAPLLSPQAFVRPLYISCLRSRPLVRGERLGQRA